MRYGHPMAMAALLAAGFALAPAAGASGARQGVKPAPGEMVLLRAVPARAAYRMAPPGQALIVDPSPKNELAKALGTGTAAGTGELSDDEYASLGAGMAGGSAQSGGGRTTVERVTGAAVSGNLRRLSGDDGALGSTGGLAQTIGGPMGTVGNVTRGIGDQVRGALAQMPLIGGNVAGTGTPPGN
ncbi:MAG TPA: hypothetical protein DCM36_08685 [Xanthomonadaceae bacterium]|nr:hypothetical protein [Xanthomonadaceae bacterium]